EPRAGAARLSRLVLADEQCGLRRRRHVFQMDLAIAVKAVCDEASVARDARAIPATVHELRGRRRVQQVLANDASVRARGKVSPVCAHGDVVAGTTDL